MYGTELDLDKVLRDRLHTSLEEIEEYCQRWQITELALFGSVIRDDFRPDSDIDVLVIFAPDYPWSLFDIIRAQEELEEKFGREVDLTQKKNIVNPFSRVEILRTHQIICPTEKATFLTIQPANKSMQDYARNNAALLNMIQAIQEIQEYTNGITYENFLANRMILQAVERDCEILGNAMKRITPEFRATHANINWGVEISLKDVQICQYDRINYAEIWAVVATELSELLEQIQKIIAPLPK